MHEIPQAGRAARGKPVVNCIAIKPNEQVAALVPVREFTDDKSLIFATRQGTVKKTVLSAYGNVRSNGICAINIDEGDELIDVQICDQNSDIVLATKDGMSIRFHQGDVRDMGRATTGVKGVELEKGDEVIGMVVVRRDATLLVVSEKGFGKRSELTDYRVQKRGGKGIITLKKTDKTGSIVALKEVIPDDELMMITRHGVIIRLPVDGIRVIGRNTQGVKVMNLDAGDTVVDVARVVKEDEGGSRGGSGRRRSGADGGRRVTAGVDPAEVGLGDARARRGPHARRRRGPHAAGRGAGPVGPGGRARTAQVRAAPADRRLQDPGRLQRAVPRRGRRPRCRRRDLIERQPRTGHRLRGPGVRPPGRRGHAGVDAEDQGRGRAPSRGRGRLRRCHPEPRSS